MDADLLERHGQGHLYVHSLRHVGSILIAVMKKEWDDLSSKHGDRLEVKYVLDKGPWGWKGQS